MIDKLQISTFLFQIENDSDFTIYPAPRKPTETDGGGVLYQCGERFVYGQKAIMNTENVNLTIKPGFGMEIHWNPAIVMNRNNFLPVSESEFRKSLDVVNNTILDAGILFDLESVNITRLDIAQDREMQEPFPVYTQLFRLLQAKRANPREYQNGYYFSNGNRQVLFYDKIAQMNSKNPDEHLEGNVMRCEYRLLKKDAVRRFAGFENISQIRSASFSDLNSFYQNNLNDFLFFGHKPNMENICYSHNENKDILARFIAEYPRNGLLHFLAAKSNFLEEIGSTANFKNLLESCGCLPSMRCKQTKALLKDMAIMAEFERSDKKTIGALYNEIYDKFIEAA